MVYILCLSYALLMVYILCLSNALGSVIQLKGFNLVKYLMSPIVLFGLVGCGTINTPDDRVDAIYNTTSAVIKGKRLNKTGIFVNGIYFVPV